MSHGGAQSPAAYDRQNLTLAQLRTRLSADSPVGAKSLAYSYQTTAELAASVVPADLSRPEGDMRRYTTIADGLAVLQTGGIGRLTLAAGATYTINARLTLTGLSNFVIDGNGATIKAANGMTVGSGTQMLLLTTCTDFEIVGLTLDGNRANRVPAETSSHPLEFSNCQRFSARRCRILNATTDGIRLQASDVLDTATYCREFLIEQCAVDNAYRNGMGIINGWDGLVIGCSFTGTNGTAPQAGADVESNDNSVDPGNRCVRFLGCRFTDNLGFGLAFSSKDAARAQAAEHCYFSNNTLGGITCSAGALVHGCEFDGFTASGAIGVEVGANANARVKITACSFRDFGASAGACIDDGSTSGLLHVSGCEFLTVAKGIDSVCARFVCTDNEIDTCTGIGITSSGTKATIRGNRVHAASTRAIYSTGTYADITGNRCTDVGGTVTAYIQAEGAGSVVTQNVCEAASSQATTLGIRASHDAAAITLNRCINLHTTQPFFMVGTESASSAHVANNTGGSVGFAPKSTRFAAKAPSFSDAGRPVASTVPIGAQIWNTTDTAPNFSDGTNWRDSAGVVT